MLSQGTTIGTHYKVVRLLGQGGMSNIYICEDSHLFGKVWAVKEFTAVYADPKEQAIALAHFEREARLLSTLSHPNLPAINEYFQFQGKYYLAMEYIQGSDLGKIIEKKGGPLSEQETADIGLQMTTVLYYLHCQKPTPIIFRDVKPSNIIICGGNVKLIDFGIARFFTPGKRGDTMRIGSPGYAPPEQYNGQTDPRSDIYSLGMTMHQCLTGQDPTLSANPFIVPPVLTLNPKVSPALAAIVQKAIKLIPEERYQSMLEMKKELRAFLKAEGRTDIASSTGLISNQPPAPTTVSSSAAQPATAPSQTPPLPIPPFQALNASPSNSASAGSVHQSSAKAHKGGTSLVSSITMPAAPITQAGSPTLSSPLIPPPARSSSSFGQPIIIPADDDDLPESPGSWKSGCLKAVFNLLLLSCLGGLGALYFGFWNPELMPARNVPLGSRPIFIHILQRSREDLSPNNYRAVYKYTVNRLKVAEVLKARVTSCPQDLAAALLKSNSDIALSARQLNFVAKEKNVSNLSDNTSDDKAQSKNDPYGLYLSDEELAQLYGPENTVSVVFPETESLDKTNSPFACGLAAAQRVFQNCSVTGGQGVMVNPIVSVKPLSTAQLVAALNVQLCQAAPCPKPGHLNSQAVISLNDISSAWDPSTPAQMYATVEAPPIYYSLNTTDKLPDLTQIVQATIDRTKGKQQLFVVQGDKTADSLNFDPQKLTNCQLISHVSELNRHKTAEGTVLLTISQVEAIPDIPASFKIAVLAPTLSAVEKLRVPDKWRTNGRLTVWTLLSYQHPYSQALALLNSGLINSETEQNINNLYTALKAADAFTLSAMRLRGFKGTIPGALAQYDTNSQTFVPISCQIFAAKANCFSPVASPSPQRDKIEE
ncbi:MAG: serine/threonine protein kinase [Candidatus Bruticola sp.]